MWTASANRQTDETECPTHPSTVVSMGNSMSVEVLLIVYLKWMSVIACPWLKCRIQYALMYSMQGDFSLPSTGKIEVHVYNTLRLLANNAQCCHCYTPVTDGPMASMSIPLPSSQFQPFVWVVHVGWLMRYQFGYYTTCYLSVWVGQCSRRRPGNKTLLCVSLRAMSIALL